VRGRELPRADDHLFPAPRFDIAQPVGIWSESAHHHSFRNVCSELDDLENGLVTKSRAAAEMNEEQETVSEQPTEVQSIEIDGETKQIPKRSLVAEARHAAFIEWRLVG